MPTEDELKTDLRRRWDDLFARVREANGDLGRRLRREHLAFGLEDDALSVTIGPRPSLVYTQRVGDALLDLDEDDRIVAITIAEFSKRARDPRYTALNDLANALRHVGRIEVPADGAGRSHEVERELRDLVPA